MELLARSKRNVYVEMSLTPTELDLKMWLSPSATTVKTRERSKTVRLRRRFIETILIEHTAPCRDDTTDVHDKSVRQTQWNVLERTGEEWTTEDKE